LRLQKLIFADIKERPKEASFVALQNCFCIESLKRTAGIASENKFENHLRFTFILK